MCYAYDAIGNRINKTTAQAGTGYLLADLCRMNAVSASVYCPFRSSTVSQQSLEFNMFKKLLVPTDGSDLSIAAAVRGVALAKMAGASMTVVFVQDTYPYTGIGEANSAGLQAYMAAAQAEGTRGIQRITDAANTAGVPIETTVVEDRQTATAIVNAAESLGADLIVMGSHGRSGVARLVLGSVAAKVLAQSPVPVLIFK